MNKKHDYKVHSNHLLYNKVYRGNIYSLTLGADGGVIEKRHISVRQKMHKKVANLATMKRGHISDIKLQLDC